MDKFDEFIDFCQKQDTFLADEVLKMHYNTDNSNRSGHIRQAFYVAFHFLIENRGEIDLIPQSDIPFELKESQLVRKWDDFLNEHDGLDYEEYSFDSLKKNLPPSLGGNREGGGAWGYPLKVVFPLVAKFID